MTVLTKYVTNDDRVDGGRPSPSNLSSSQRDEIISGAVRRRASSRCYYRHAGGVTNLYMYLHDIVMHVHQQQSYFCRSEQETHLRA